MKKLLTLMLGLAFLAGTYAIAQEAPKEEKQTTKKKKSSKKKKSEKEAPPEQKQ
jgi:Ni/Co efflux regulator RcnB